MAVPDWPDRDLVVAFKAGERWAYDEMYRRYGARVEGICRRMLGNVEDAHEATQETFLKAYQGLPRFNGNYKLGAWLSRIAANVCLDQIRSRSRRATLVPLANEDAARDLDLGPEDLVGTGDRAFTTLDEIQPLHAQALALRAIEGMSHKEMADRLDMTPQQVKALLHRARDSFKRAWENASGWIAAPVLALRFLSTGEKSGPAGAHMVVMSSSASPLLAEKVAASAIVVAAALSGASAAAVVETASSPSVRAALATPATTMDEESPPVTLESKVAAAIKKGALDKVVALVEEAKESTHDDRADEDNNKNDDDGGGETDPRRAGTKMVKKVKETVEDLTDI
jgi:RNA polymerase sigma-70 factor (ECF subfamily)